MEHSTQNFDYDSIQSTTPQVNSSEALQIAPVLGLKLSQTPEFLKRLQQLAEKQSLKLSNLRRQPNSKTGHSSAKPKSKDVFMHQIMNKMKAESFPISLIKIGSWERVSRNGADLVAKCYFAKRKLVWEILENGLKNKIEFQWSDITFMKVSMQENQSAILEIELNSPPSFYHEMDPQPRKHAQWTDADDFTGGQARTFRRHCLEFSPGVLQKPLGKLLKSDTRLSRLMQQDFPTLKSPYFDLSFNSRGKGNLNFEQQQLLSFSNVPTYDHITPNPSYSALPDKGFSEQIKNEMPLWDPRITNNVRDSFIHVDIDDQVFNEMSLWGQGMNNVGDTLAANQVGEMYFATSSSSGFQVFNSTTSFQEEEEEAVDELAGLVPSLPTRFEILNDRLQTMSVDNSPIGLYSGSIMENDSNNMTANYELNVVDNVVVMSNNLSSSSGGRLIYSRPQSPVVDENRRQRQMVVRAPQIVLSRSVPGTSTNMVNDNSFFYLSANSNPTLQYFSGSTSK
ncbi:hypothetical protein V6N13_019934 [Hibiscus sabdariffa]|uniref:TRF2/HOY1 PH-like domain-containing protein n=1 Tax=Hibiscus sabdariffa TaxID=183260 RepID=A0ABR2ERZ3_9ROSI